MSERKTDRQTNSARERRMRDRVTDRNGDRATEER